MNLLHPQPASPRRPRIGFLGVGWIGMQRLEALADSDVVEAAAIADPAVEARALGRRAAPGATQLPDLEALLSQDLDGVVIASPSALHAEQSLRALDAGLAVFCQKPLGCRAGEARAVIEKARSADRLLGVDLSYRFVRGAERIRAMARDGEIGEVYAAELAFHNAYGPDRPWYYRRGLSGGGCVIDLGIHLVDLALWVLGFPRVTGVTARLYARGERLRRAPAALEDFAVARLDLESGATVQLSCSWLLSTGCDAVIRASFYGTRGALVLRNVRGSFYDFRAEHHRGTRRRILEHPPDAWGGRAAVAWAKRLLEANRYDPLVESYLPVAEVLDAIYAGGEPRAKPDPGS